MKFRFHFHHNLEWFPKQKQVFPNAIHEHWFKQSMQRHIQFPYCSCSVSSSNVVCNWHWVFNPTLQQEFVYCSWQFVLYKQFSCMPPIQYMKYLHVKWSAGLYDVHWQRSEHRHAMGLLCTLLPPAISNSVGAEWMGRTVVVSWCLLIPPEN